VERRKCFRLKYPRLYSICNDKAALVGEVGTFSGRDTDWSFHWRRHLFMWEEELLLSLKEDLEGMVWSQAEDVWRWNLDDMGMFSVKSAYDKLEGLALSEVRWRVEDKRVFQDLWKTPALSKVSALVWRVLLIVSQPRIILLCIGNVGWGGIRISKRAVGLFGFQPFGCCGKSGMTRSSMEEILRWMRLWR